MSPQIGKLMRLLCHACTKTSHFPSTVPAFSRTSALMHITCKIDAAWFSFQPSRIDASTKMKWRTAAKRVPGRGDDHAKRGQTRYSFDATNSFAATPLQFAPDADFSESAESAKKIRQFVESPRGELTIIPKSLEIVTTVACRTADGATESRVRQPRAGPVGRNWAWQHSLESLGFRV